MRRILLLLLNCLDPYFTLAQSLDGMWFSTSMMNIQQRTESTELVDGQLKTTQLDHIKVDTFYHSAEAILNFLPSNNFEIKGLGNLLAKGTFNEAGDTIIAQLDTLLLKFVNYKEDKLLMVDLDSGWQYNHVIFERLLPQATKELFVPEFLSSNYWTVEANSNSSIDGLELHILDSGNLIISYFGDDFGYTTFGDYKIDTYQNNLYFYFVDLYSIDDKLFRLFEWDGHAFEAQWYQVEFGKKQATKHDFKFRSERLPSDEDLKSIKNKLIAKWSLHEGGIPFDPDFSDYNEVKNEFFDFIIEGSTFTIQYGGDFLNTSKKDFLQEEVTGTWELGATGKYLEMSLASGETRYLTILEISKKRFAFDMGLKSPDSRGIYNSDPIKLKKR